MPLIRPRRLAPGQTIGLVAPSSAPNEPDRLPFAAETIESLGFRVRTGKHLHEREGYLAGSDNARAHDLNAMFADDSIDAIWCVRGGYGASRLLPLLDYDLIRRKPKALIGYSDITALHMAIQRHVGLVTFHGPVAWRALPPYTLEGLHRVLWRTETPVRLAEPPLFERREGQVDWDNRVVTLVPGKARGRLLGGNLCLMSHLVGTPYLPDLRGSILFLEDVEEAYYRVDRMLTQLWLAGALDGVAGVAFGKFTDCEPSPFFLQNRPLQDILAERFRELRIPAISVVMVGHIPDQATLPVGCQAELDADAGTLTLLEPGVV